MKFVLDASFAISWIMESERTPKAEGYFQALKVGDATAVVPALWPDEMANVLLTLERGKKISPFQVTDWVNAFCSLPIEVDFPSIDDSLGEVRRLAKSYGLSAYDARYLHLAMREGLPLATKDKQLLRVATEVGLELVPF